MAFIRAVDTSIQVTDYGNPTQVRGGTWLHFLPISAEDVLPGTGVLAGAFSRQRTRVDLTKPSRIEQL